MTEPLPEPSPHTLRRLEAGLQLFNVGLWWEAHEEWEEAWLREEGRPRVVLQGLILLAAAYHKGLRMKNPAAMERLFTKALSRLEEAAREGPSWQGLDLGRLLTAAVEGRVAAASWARGERPGFDERLVVRLERLPPAPG